MTVQELFKNLDRDTFIDEYLNYCGEPKSAKRKAKLENLLDAFNNINVIPNNSLIVFCEPIVGENHLDSTVIKKEEINTYREKDHDYLMAIRNGYYMNEDGTIKPELYKELDLLKSKMKDLERTTKLPEKPYYKDAENLLIKLNKMSLDIAECKKTEIGFLSKFS